MVTLKSQRLRPTYLQEISVSNNNPRMQSSSPPCLPPPVQSRRLRGRRGDLHRRVLPRVHLGLLPGQPLLRQLNRDVPAGGGSTGRFKGARDEIQTSTSFLRPVQVPICAVGMLWEYSGTSVLRRKKPRSFHHKSQ